MFKPRFIKQARNRKGQFKSGVSEIMPAKKRLAKKQTEWIPVIDNTSLYQNL